MAYMKHNKKLRKKKKVKYYISMVLSYQRQLVVLVSHRHCAGAHLASPQTGGRTLQSDGALSPAPAQHKHTVP